MMRRAIECDTWVLMSPLFTQSVLLGIELTPGYLIVAEPINLSGHSLCCTCLHFDMQTFCDARQEFPAAIYSDIGLGLKLTSSRY